MDANIIVLAGFTLFIILALRFGYAKAIRGLDAGITDVKKNLDTAMVLREQALKELQEQQLREKALSASIDELYQRKEEELSVLRAQAEEELTVLLETRARNADMIFDKLRLETIGHINTTVSALTLSVLEKLSTDFLNSAQHQQLNIQAIEQIAGIFEQQQEAKRVAG